MAQAHATVLPLDIWLGAISQLRPEDFKGNEVHQFLSKYSFDPDGLIPWMVFREDDYAKNLVFHSPSFELLVLAWLPGQTTAIHGHNGQQSWNWVYSGEITIEAFQWDSIYRKLNLLGSPQIHTDNKLFFVDDEMGMHCLSNESTKPAISIHLNAGPIDSCTEYDPRANALKVVETQYFTTDLLLPDIDALDQEL